MWIVTTRVLHEIGPVTVAAERSGLLTRWLAPIAGSNPAWSSNLRVCTPIGRGNAPRPHPVLVRVEPDAPICSVTHLVRRPDCPSGEREAVSLRSANHQGIGEPGRPHVSRKDGIVGSNPTTLTILSRSSVDQSTAFRPRRPRVQIAPGHPSCFAHAALRRISHEQDALRSFSEGGLSNMEGGARWRATGFENRADLKGRGFDSFTFRQPSRLRRYGWQATSCEGCPPKLQRRRAVRSTAAGPDRTRSASGR
jgi:hypothetical protein